MKIQLTMAVVLLAAAAVFLFSSTCLAYCVIYCLAAAGTLYLAWRPGKAARAPHTLFVVSALWLAASVALLANGVICPVHARTPSGAGGTASPVDVMFCERGEDGIYAINTSCDGDGLLFASALLLFSATCAVACLVQGIWRLRKLRHSRGLDAPDSSR